MASWTSKARTTLHRTVVEKRETQWGTSETTRSVPAATREGTVEVTVDVERLVREYAGRALRSKGGKAQIAGGAIKIVRRSFKDTPIAEA